MCLAVPMLVESITGEMARVTLGGVSRDIAITLTPEARIGDHVLVHAGFAISVVDEQYALETLRLLEELDGPVYQ
ncbi:MAG: HypC/HybG/HupF family hydrogenase formation chaperone [Candidatus Geothermincolia bacterium]